VTANLASRGRNSNITCSNSGSAHDFGWTSGPANFRRAQAIVTF
jgi:hypothetical protein